MLLGFCLTMKKQQMAFTNPQMIKAITSAVALSPNLSGIAITTKNIITIAINADAQLGIPVKNEFLLLVFMILIFSQNGFQI